MAKHLTFREAMIDDRIVVYTEVTSICNNKCVFCPIDKLERKGQITQEIQDRLVSFFANNPHKKFRVFFHLLGEPLLFKGLEGYITRLNHPHVELWMSTNGILLTPDRLQKLHAAGLRNIWFSMFYANEEEYLKNTSSEFFKAAKNNLESLLSRHAIFRRIHVVTFAHDAEHLTASVKGLRNVTLQKARAVEEWRYDEKPLRRSLFFMMKKFHLMKYFCITSEGSVAFEWKDYNTEDSPGNVMNLRDADILDAYYRSGVFNWPRQRVASMFGRLLAQRENIQSEYRGNT